MFPLEFCLGIYLWGLIFLFVLISMDKEIKSKTNEEATVHYGMSLGWPIVLCFYLVVYTLKIPIWVGRLLGTVIKSHQFSYDKIRFPEQLSPSTDTSELDELRLEVEELKLILSGYENVKANLSKLLDCEDEPRWKWIVLEVSNMKDELTAARKQHLINTN